MKNRTRLSIGTQAILLSAAALAIVCWAEPARAAQEVTYFTYGATDSAVRFGFWTDDEFYGYRVTILRQRRSGRMMIVKSETSTSSSPRTQVTNGSVNGLRAGYQYYLRLRIQWEPDGSYTRELIQPFVTDL